MEDKIVSTGTQQGKLHIDDNFSPVSNPLSLVCKEWFKPIQGAPTDIFLSQNISTRLNGPLYWSLLIDSVGVKNPKQK